MQLERVSLRREKRDVLARKMDMRLEHVSPLRAGRDKRGGRWDMRALHVSRHVEWWDTLAMISARLRWRNGPRVAMDQACCGVSSSSRSP